MIGGRRDKLQELRRGSKGETPTDTESAAKSVSDGRLSSTSPVSQRGAEIRPYLGIDFGTRFTKVVIHLPHLDTRAPLSLGPDGTALHPSRLAIRDGIAFPPDVSAPPDAEWIDYLKMRLFTGGQAEFDEGRGRSREEIAALAALYLAGVLRLAQTSTFNLTRRLRGVNVRWSAQVGVPTKTYDSTDLGVFEDVAAVAWAWKDEPPVPRPLDDVVASYVRARDSRLSREESPIVAAPELVATISHLAFRSDAPEGLYALLDIGGGTLDGTVFELRRAPRVTVDILAAQVEPLGTIPIARRISSGAGGVEVAEKRLVAGRLTELDEQKLSGLEEKVSCVLRKVIAEAVRKRPAHDFVTLGPSNLDGHLRTRDYRPINVLLAGGGATSGWYKGVFERLDMRNWRVGSLKTQVIPRPRGWSEDNYPRFVVANGLSNRDLQLRAAYQLPTDIPEAPIPPDWKIKVDSPISKDLV
jgi:hypothetical protein